MAGRPSDAIRRAPLTTGVYPKTRHHPQKIRRLGLRRSHTATATGIASGIEPRRAEANTAKPATRNQSPPTRSRISEARKKSLFSSHGRNASASRTCIRLWRQACTSLSTDAPSSWSEGIPPSGSAISSPYRRKQHASSARKTAHLDSGGRSLPLLILNDSLEQVVPVRGYISPWGGLRQIRIAQFQVSFAGKPNKFSPIAR